MSISMNYSCSSGVVAVTWGQVLGANSYRWLLSLIYLDWLCCSMWLLHLPQLNAFFLGPRVISDPLSRDWCFSQSGHMVRVKLLCPLSLKVALNNTHMLCTSAKWLNDQTVNVLSRAEAVDVNGTALSCTSASNTCQITMLNCGERYLIQVTAISFDCQSTSNTSTYFETGEGHVHVQHTSPLLSCYPLLSVYIFLFYLICYLFQFLSRSHSHSHTHMHPSTPLHTHIQYTFYQTHLICLQQLIPMSQSYSLLNLPIISAVCYPS